MVKLKKQPPIIPNLTCKSGNTFIQLSDVCKTESIENKNKRIWRWDFFSENFTLQILIVLCDILYKKKKKNWRQYEDVRFNLKWKRYVGLRHVSKYFYAEKKIPCDLTRKIHQGIILNRIEVFFFQIEMD